MFPAPGWALMLLGELPQVPLGDVRRVVLVALQPFPHCGAVHPGLFCLLGVPASPQCIRHALPSRAFCGLDQLLAVLRPFFPLLRGRTRYERNVSDTDDGETEPSRLLSLAHLFV